MANLLDRLGLATGDLLRRTKRGSGIHLGAGVRAFGLPLLATVPGAEIHLGAGVRLVSSDRFTPLGVNHRVVIRALAPGARVEIGEDTGISGGTICAAGSVRIGRRCLLGANVTVVDTDFHPVHEPLVRYAAPLPPFESGDEVVIGDHVFLGTGSIVLKGVTIGENSVIGAGSVVTGDVPPDSIAAGNPARVIGSVRAPAVDS